MSMAMIVFFKALLVVPITLLPILNPIDCANLSVDDRADRTGNRLTGWRNALRSIVFSC